MAQNPKHNFLVIILLMIITLVTAFQEGYFPLISVCFWLSLLAGFGICFWLACHIPTRRLLALILSISIIEYVQETIGIRSGMWVYQGVHRSYNFAICCWILAGLTIYTLSTKIIIKLIRSLKLPVTRRVNASIIFVLFLLIPITLTGSCGEAGDWFWSFYILVLFTCLNLVSRLDFPVLAGVVVTSWIVSTSGEYLGAISSHAWTFPLNPNYPPFYLVICCWPLEVLAQYALAALLAGDNPKTILL